MLNPVIANAITFNQMTANVPVFEESRNRGIEESVIENTSRTARFTPPTVEDVKAYCLERKNGVDAERFVDFYTSKGWMVGKTKMKDWKSAVRTWERGDNRGTNGNAGGTPAKTRDWNLDAIVL